MQVKGTHYYKPRPSLTAGMSARSANNSCTNTIFIGEEAQRKLTQLKDLFLPERKTQFGEPQFNQIKARRKYFLEKAGILFDSPYVTIQKYPELHAMYVLLKDMSIEEMVDYFEFNTQLDQLEMQLEAQLGLEELDYQDRDYTNINVVDNYLDDNGLIANINPLTVNNLIEKSYSKRDETTEGKSSQDANQKLIS